MGKNKSASEGIQKQLQILAISLSILGIFLYIIGYAYYWGALEAYSLSPLDFPLKFDGYIAMGFLAVVTIFNRIVEFFDWVSVLAQYSALVATYLVIIITFLLLIKYVPDLKDKKVSSPSLLVKPLEKIAGFFYPVKEAIFLPYFAIFAYFVIFAMISLLLLFPLTFFMIGNNVAKEQINSFDCSSETPKCTVIKTDKLTFTGEIVVKDSDVRILFDGSRLHTIQTKHIQTETR